MRAVEEQSDVLGLEAADQPPVVTGICAERSGAHAGGVAQHLVELVRLLVADLLRADDGHRLRRLHDRRVGLGAGRAATRDVAVHRAKRRLDEADIALQLGLAPVGSLHRRPRRTALRPRGRTAARFRRGDGHRRQVLRATRRGRLCERCPRHQNQNGRGRQYGRPQHSKAVQRATPKLHVRCVMPPVPTAACACSDAYVRAHEIPN